MAAFTPTVHHHRTHPGGYIVSMSPLRAGYQPMVFVGHPSLVTRIVRVAPGKGFSPEPVLLPKGTQAEILRAASERWDAWWHANGGK